jgi:hypothetical protein
VIAWIVRGLLIVSGTVTGWFVAEDALNFEIVQMAVALILLALVVFALAFWPEGWTRWLNRRGGAE